MEHRPLISIATPCWNAAATIERTIKSVLAQEFKDYEYIIVDGGSTDGTLDIIRKYEPLFEGRMKWKSEPDKGLYDAFNKGVERSTGIYCWNVNADDFIEPDAIAKLASVIKTQSKPTVIVGSMNVLSQKLELQYRTTISAEKISRAYEKDWMIPHPATVVHKTIYEAYGAFDCRFKICGDMDWFHRTYSAGVVFEPHSELLLTNMLNDGISNQAIYKKESNDRWLFFTKKYGKGSKRLLKFVQWHKLYLKSWVKNKIGK